MSTPPSDPGAFDAYHKWLGIPAAEQPPNFYRLLAISVFEDDPDVIEIAADQRMSHLRTYQTGPHSALSQELLNEVAAARLCLLSVGKKSAYDAELRRRTDAAQPKPVIPTERQFAQLPAPVTIQAVRPMEPSQSVFAGPGASKVHARDARGARRWPSFAWALVVAMALPVVVFVASSVWTKPRPPRGDSGPPRGQTSANAPESESLSDGDEPASDPFENDAHDEGAAAGGEHQTSALELAANEAVSETLKVIRGAAPGGPPQAASQETSAPGTSPPLPATPKTPAQTTPRVVGPTEGNGSGMRGPKPTPIPGLDDPAFQQWLKECEGLPAEQLFAAVLKKLRELNGGLKSKRLVTYKTEHDTITEIAIFSPTVKKLLPLRALRDLKSFTYAPGLLADLSPLAGMPLTHLVCSHSRVSDLSPLRGMPLSHLDCSSTSVSDLSPLAGMPLRSLICARTPVADLSPLAGMPLTRLDVSHSQVADLSPLQNLPLADLKCSDTRVSDVSPLRGAPLKSFVCLNTQIADLSPLEGVLGAIPFSGRGAVTKTMLLGKYGGTPDSEAAVALALAWLARNQRKDGSWSLTGPYRSGSPQRDVPEAATAMALLAFQGAGNTPLIGEFKKQVAAGIQALLKFQAGDGNFVQSGAENRWFYAHGQCTAAVCELYGMTKDHALKKPAELAIKFCIDSQDPERGGWKYLPRAGSDTSVTGCILMALQTARMAELEVPANVLTRASEYLDKATPDGSRYSYEGGEPTLATTAEALLCRQYLGWRRDDPRLVQGVELVIQNLPRYEDRDVYYWYYGTRLMHNMEGKYWSAWNGALRDMLVKHQEKTGLEKGSWDPLGEHPDRWSNQGQGMRLYTTCFSIWMLEAYYRHLPIYGVKR